MPWFRPPRANLPQGSGDCTGPMDPDRRVRITRKTGVASIRPSANFFFGNVFFGGPSWTFFSDFSWGSFGPLAAAWARVRIHRPCASNLAGGASVALMIRSEYLQKGALLLFGGGTKASVAEVPPKKFRLGSLAESSGRRTDSLHIHSGSWPPGPETLSFCRVSGRVRITRKYAVVSAWALIGPSTDLALGSFFGEGRLGTFFGGVD